jgi:hypothetical protein
MKKQLIKEITWDNTVTYYVALNGKRVSERFRSIETAQEFYYKHDPSPKKYTIMEEEIELTAE